MKFTLSWLKDHLETAATCEEVVDTLNFIGFEVEQVIGPREDLKDFRIVQVVHVEPHPNADRLKVCRITTGEETLGPIVCGASNVRENLRTVLALPGMCIPHTGKILVPATIRGVESKGMLCSASELNLGEESEGILDLGNEAPVGGSLVAYKGLDDPVIEISVTPNRGDALGIRGIARDLAAAGLGSLRILEQPSFPREGACPVSIVLPKAMAGSTPCLAFALREVRAVDNGPSPQWLQNRLLAVGLRPITRLVDVTNYMTIDQGRPLHVFDRAKIQGNLEVRFAHDGETLEALNGVTYTLDSSILVIADEQGVLSIAGIIGGMSSGCTPTTTDVLIESAVWDPLVIARAGRRLGIISDARHRFERGVDGRAYHEGLNQATAQVIALCGGVASESMDVCAPEFESKAPYVVCFPWSEVERLTGVQVSVQEGISLLTKLGFAVTLKNAEEALITVPSWRSDVHGKADLVEEIIRLAGVDHIPPIPLPPSVHARPLELPHSLQKAHRVRHVLATRGLCETVTWSFISSDMALLFGGGDERLTLANPLSPNWACLRPSLIPGLLHSMRQNQNRGVYDMGIFEIGSVFSSPEPEGQKQMLAGFRMGTACETYWGRSWRADGRSVSIFDVKSDLETVFRSFNISLEALRVESGDNPPWYHPGRSGTYYKNKIPLGCFGEIHPSFSRQFDLKEPVVFFELALDALDSVPVPRSRKALRLSELQPLTRDFAFIIDRDMPVSSLIRAVRMADRSLIVDVRVFDIYEGVGIEPHQRSVALSVTFQPFEKTLTESEIGTASQRIIDKVAEHTRGTLRI